MPFLPPNQQRQSTEALSPYAYEFTCLLSVGPVFCWRRRAVQRVSATGQRAAVGISQHTAVVDVTGDAREPIH